MNLNLGLRRSRLKRTTIRDSAEKQSSLRRSTVGSEIVTLLEAKDSSLTWLFRTSYNKFESTGSVVYDFSPIYEAKIFYGTSISISLAEGCEQIIHFMALLVATHTPHHSELVASLGLCSMFICITVKYALWGIQAYMDVIISSSNEVSITKNVRQGLIMGIVALSPFLLLLIFAETIMRDVLFIENIPANLGHYCRLMIITSLLELLQASITVVMISLGHTTFLLSMSILCMVIYFPVLYVFLVNWHMGLIGIAIASIAHTAFRLVMWIIYMWYFDLIWVIHPLPGAAWPTKAEKAEFFRIASWTVIGEFSEGAVYELMIFFLWKIKDVPLSLLGYATVWMEVMFLFEALQEGFVYATFQRTLGLIWEGHPKAKSTYALNSMLSIMTVLLASIVFLACYRSYSGLMTSDKEENEWGIFLVWTLVLQVLTMMIRSCSFTLFKAIKKGFITVVVNLLASFAIATPITIFFISDNSISIHTRACICFCTGTIANCVSAPIGFAYAYSMNWKALAMKEN